MKKLFLAGICLLFIFSACNDKNAQSSSEKEDMGQFADDKSFRNAHEKPEKLDFDAQGEMIRYSTPDGKEGAGYLVKSEEASDDFLFVIHEWWGLNDQIKQEAERLQDSLSNVTVLALDLYDGKVTDNADEAGKYMQSVKQERAEAIIQGAIVYAGDAAKIATIGWCFGGGWSLNASILAGENATGCVMYYGMPVQTADKLAPLKADILGIFASGDGWINKEVVGDFEALAKATGQKLDVHWFDADHAFANPSSPRYNEAAAQEANKIALSFLKESL